LSDLTLNFGEKSWQIHKALACCHSKWFQKAVTIGFKVSVHSETKLQPWLTLDCNKETTSEVITLNDDPDFTNAIDCMVSYFYKASYDVSQYDTSESLLHAKVATMADKYDCASLYKLARKSLAESVNLIKGEDWVAVAAYIYDHTTTEYPPHEELRSLVVTAVTNRPSVLNSILGLKSTAGLLRSTVDLATDILLSRRHTSEYIFICDKCRYVHVGPRDCSYVASLKSSLYEHRCPVCKNCTGLVSKRFVHYVDLVQPYSCPFCDGFHTIEPALAHPLAPEPSPVDTDD
jgi:hypothetical protein